MWREKWEAAFLEASYYKSDKNTKEFWDKGVDKYAANDPLVNCLMEWLREKKLLTSGDTALDIGCGNGRFTIAFAKLCKKVTALDYSENALKACRLNVANAGCENVSYVDLDFSCEPLEGRSQENELDEAYDFVLAILNPATYNPKAFDKMVSLTRKCIIYLSTDQPIATPSPEKVYNQCQLVDYPYNYLVELGYKPEKLKYDFKVKLPDGREVVVPFAFLICDVKG